MDKIYKISAIMLATLAVLLVFASTIKTIYSNNLTYIVAEYVKIYDEVDVFGVFIKDETLIKRDEVGYTNLTISSGEKVTQNQILANVYTEDSYVRLSNELKATNELISVLKTIDATSSAKTNILINDAIVKLNNDLNPNDVLEFISSANAIKLLSIRRAFDDMTSEDISEEISRLSSLSLEIEQDLLENQRSISSNESGYFIEGIDGYEGVYDFSTSEILNLQNEKIEVKTSQEYLGKIVTDFSWYYVCVVDEAQLNSINSTTKLSIIFDKLPQAIVDVTVESIIYEDGLYKVYFKGDSKQNELFKLRTSGASIVLDTQYGIKIPKEATRIIDGTLGVYTLSGTTQRFKSIEKIYEGLDYYLIAQPKNPTKNDIISGDKIIINSKNLN